uniref:Uncharacterized protein n=1 Tax=Acrobeloides nanus TaxID=290746 RepID=A0A914CA60_9BILA
MISMMFKKAHLIVANKSEEVTLPCYDYEEPEKKMTVQQEQLKENSTEDKHPTSEISKKYNLRPRTMRSSFNEED